MFCNSKARVAKLELAKYTSTGSLYFENEKVELLIPVRRDP